MITRPVLEEKRKQYLKAREEAIGTVQALGGAVEAMDELLALVEQADAAQAAAAEAAPKESGNA